MLCFRNTPRLFRLAIVRIHSDTVRDTLWAFYAPMSAMLFPLAWVILLMIGFTMMFWGVSEPSLGTALSLSGAAITTKGVPGAERGSPDQHCILLVGSLVWVSWACSSPFCPPSTPFIHSVSKRCRGVAFRFGAPPSGVEGACAGVPPGTGSRTDQFWHTWEDWFTDMAETHLSNSEVIFYRSVPSRHPLSTTVRSWMRRGLLFLLGGSAGCALGGALAQASCKH